MCSARACLGLLPSISWICVTLLRSPSRVFRGSKYLSRNQGDCQEIETVLCCSAKSIRSG